MSWFGSVRLYYRLKVCSLPPLPLLIGWAGCDGGGRVASRRGVVSTRRRVLLCMLVFIYKFVKWGAARHKRHKQSRRTRGKTCCYNCVSFCVQYVLCLIYKGDVYRELTAACSGVGAKQPHPHLVSFNSLFADCLIVASVHWDLGKTVPILQ